MQNLQTSVDGKKKKQKKQHNLTFLLNIIREWFILSYRNNDPGWNVPIIINIIVTVAFSWHPALFTAEAEFIPWT